MIESCIICGDPLMHGNGNAHRSCYNRVHRHFREQEQVSNE